MSTPILTASRLARLAAYPHLKSTWYFIAAATLQVCNEPTEIPTLYKYALEHSPEEEHLKVTEKMRESLLKTSALSGLPKGINALTELKNVTPKHLRATEPLRDPHNMDFSSGASFFDQVYGKIATRVRNNMAQAYPDLADYAVNHVYASLLSNTKVLGPKETSLVVVACLVPQDVNPQLKGHLKGALNNGATKDEVMSVRSMAMEIAQWCGVKWKNDVAKL